MSQGDNEVPAYDKLKEMHEKETRDLLAVIDPKTLKRIDDSMKTRIKILETVEIYGPYIQEWEMHMDDETCIMFTACKDGNYSLCNDGSVYFGLQEELHLVAEINGVPHAVSHVGDHWLMRPKNLKQPQPWGVYDCNMKLEYGPFETLEEAKGFIVDKNFSVEGVHRAL